MTVRQKAVKKRVAIVTNNLNCERNTQYYSTIEKYFTANGWEICDDFNVNKVIISGCGFHDAMYKKIRRTVEYLRTIHFLEKNIIIVGCTPRTHEYDLNMDFKGNVIYLRKEEELDKNIGAEISFADLKLNNLYKPHGQFEVPPEEQFFHIKISQGCLKECTFCVINKAKGYIRSIPREEVIKQYKTAIQRGYRKIFLMGEDTFAYGIDTGNTIVQLMEDLLEIEDKVQFDFGSVHIKWLKEYSEAILSWCERGLIKKLNVGLQHVNDKILKLMGRPVVFSEVYDVLKEVKKAAPDLYLGVDIIVGFPGETREIFEEIAAFFRNDTCLDNVSLSGYSDVKGAPSCGFENKNSEVEVTTRWSYLTDHVLGNRSAFNREDKTGDTDESFKVNYESDYLFCKGTFKDEITKIAGSAEAVSAESKVLEKDDGDFGF